MPRRRDRSCPSATPSWPIWPPSTWARLATQQPGGTLQVSPAGLGYNPATGTIGIGGINMTASRKYRNMAANGRVAFVGDDIISAGPWRVRCVEVRGYGEAIPAPAGPAAPAGGPIIRVHPRRIISFGIEDQATSRMR